ncbi:peroxynitrite isomerase THAP4-like [Sciurus carolinensis]|uniref:peroxynitrite isomerase THAP4-like n=1 Tax=Sciurus carolinensis TaxID=30640 RepID=UPI001FB2FFB1|nr:peroxynitrite isomerase THAP4-like [Sciurus carolinensis]
MPAAPLCPHSFSTGRPWFNRWFPIARKFRLNYEGKLEQMVSMATTTQPLTQHLHVTYKKVTSKPALQSPGPVRLQLTGSPMQMLLE